MENSMNARLVKWNLFSPNYPTCKLQFRDMPDCYVSEAISDKEIVKWGENRDFDGHIQLPVLISAQTGRGKNYFVTHNLREFAKRHGERILYISNRVALDYQQKQELAKLTSSKFTIRPTNVDGWEKRDEFSNVTVLTYHKLFSYLKQPEEWFQQFSYVVLDECHFFYSDAFFNPHTGYILKAIPQKFSKSVRIYMSATFDDVLEPIRYYEGLASNSVEFGHMFDRSFYTYRFPRNFTSYSPFYFTNLKQISEIIQLERNKKDKWLIFVTGKEAGKKLCEELNDLEDSGIPEDSEDTETSFCQYGTKPQTAIYIDSQSRYDSNIYNRLQWENITSQGKFESKVLITTSVLDNGFSLKDDEIKNIVICADDETEFLQELGRCRIARDSTINLYIGKLTKRDQENRKRIFESYSSILLRYFGDKDMTPLACDKTFSGSGNPCDAVRELWNSREDARRNLIYLASNEKGTALYPEMNEMARWRVKRLGQQIEEYDAMWLENESLAPLKYKARWLSSSQDEEFTLSDNFLQSRDLDLIGLNSRLNSLVEYLEAVAEHNGIMGAEDGSFDTFSTKFLQLYRAAFPNDKSINRGKSRTWGPIAVNNHLKTVNEAIKERTLKFNLEEESEEKGWSLRKISE